MPGKAVGFWRGFVAPFVATRQLLGLPRAWPLMLVPVLMFGLVEAIVVAVSWRFLKPWAYAKLSGDGSLQQLGATTASWLGVGFAGVLGWLLAGLLAPVLSAPALERVVDITEQDLAVPARAPLGFLAEFWCGFRSLLASSAVSLLLVVALTLLEMVVPAAALVATPLKLLLASLGVAWGLFDYPLTLRGMGARARFAFMQRHFSVVLGFGAAFSLAFWLPCFGLAMLPIGVAAATRLYWEIERTR